MIENQPFLITGSGRSGTKFLAKLMNKSKAWTVRHEARDYRPWDVDTSPISFYRDVFVSGYGEVNSSMWNMLGKLTWVREGVLLRDPMEIALSFVNRRPEKKWVLEMRNIVRVYTSLDDYLSHNPEVRTISFHRMTTDVGYVKDLLGHFGISDVPVAGKLIRTVVNKTKKASHKKLPKDLSRIVEPVCFMREKWNF